MAMQRDELRWNGWGYQERSFGLSEERARALVAALAERLGVRFSSPPPAAALEQAKLPASRLDARAERALLLLLNRERVHTDARERAYHAAGKSLPDILRLRSGELERAPDVVAYPSSAAEVAGLLAWAEAQRVSVIPFGGGTSVVGGVDPQLGADQHAVLTLDTTRPARQAAVARSHQPYRQLRGGHRRAAWSARWPRTATRWDTFRNPSSTRRWVAGSRRAPPDSSPTATAASMRCW